MIFRLSTDFICLYTYEFCLSLGKIARSSVILLLALFSNLQYSSFTDLVLWIEIRTLDILLLMNIVILLTLNILRVFWRLKRLSSSESSSLTPPPLYSSR